MAKYATLYCNILQYAFCRIVAPLVMVVAKLTYLVAIIGGHVTTQLPPIVRFKTKQNFIWVKDINNAFDHIELCFVLKTEEE